MHDRVILASESAVRRRLLEQAGVSCQATVSGVDENPVKQSCREAGRSAAETALKLAEHKAFAVSAEHPEALVIGADQILECDGAWFDKPVTRAAAAEHLDRLSGRQHALETAAVVARGGEIQWQCVDTVRLTMRPLTPDFIDAYLESIGDAAFRSVGAYQLEGMGAQLFTRVEGDFFSVLGLPLLPLLDFLRKRSVLVT